MSCAQYPNFRRKSHSIVSWREEPVEECTIRLASAEETPLLRRTLRMPLDDDGIAEISIRSRTTGGPDMRARGPLPNGSVKQPRSAKRLQEAPVAETRTGWERGPPAVLSGIAAMTPLEVPGSGWAGVVRGYRRVRERYRAGVPGRGERVIPRHTRTPGVRAFCTRGLARGGPARAFGALLVPPARRSGHPRRWPIRASSPRAGPLRFEGVGSAVVRGSLLSFRSSLRIPLRPGEEGKTAPMARLVNGRFDREGG